MANEFLTSFALAASGDKLASHFSKQRRWLEDTFNGFKHYTDKSAFIHFFGNYAEFYKSVWIEYKGQNDLPIPMISSHPDAELVSLLILYLKESNHKMAITVLASFYNAVLDGEEHSITNFVKATKLIARFYTIWRSAEGNAGLDNVYRSFFRGEGDTITANHWVSKRTISLDALSSYLESVLEEKELNTRNSWLRKAKGYLSYNRAKPVCRFALFASADQTIPDPNFPGLMKHGVSGTTAYLTLRKWNSLDLKTIEHIAPQKPSDNEQDFWDDKIYADEENELYHRVGNLTLLPQNVNISASNKGWAEKYLYYQHLSEKDKEKQQELANRARVNGIVLATDTIRLLQESRFNDHMLAIEYLEEDGSWDAVFVKARTQRILEILWNKLSHI
ncbi:MAG: HNH endonuclease family protein [Bacteroidota bacterium]